MTVPWSEALALMLSASDLTSRTSTSGVASTTCSILRNEASLAVPLQKPSRKKANAPRLSEDCVSIVRAVVVIEQNRPAIVLLYEERPPFCHWFCPLPTVSLTLVLVTVAWALPQECSAKVSSSMSKGCSPNARLGDDHQSAGQIETE